MKLSLIVVLFEEMFIPHSGLRSNWDTIGAMLYLIKVENFLIGPNLTYNPGFTFGDVTVIVRKLLEFPPNDYVTHTLISNSI